ncbi:uncharacterized protein VTP21DRAFT_9248 [Calcarisporiella thermophila]|uniref:uncharacterized protein n=1 Tax=Calcarisporiella thermophila TaxID=911321 RepID=UPI003741EC4A
MYPGSTVTRMLGDEVFSSEGKIWRRHRKAANPAFHRGWKIELFSKSANQALSVLHNTAKRNEGDKGVVVNGIFGNLALDVMGRALYKYEFNALHNPESPEAENFYKMLSQVFSVTGLLVPLIHRINGFAKEAVARIERFEAHILGILNERKMQHSKTLASSSHEQPETEYQSDLLTTIIEANEKEVGGPDFLTDSELLGNLKVFYVAGTDTSANTIVTCLYFLATNPDIQERARNEIISYYDDNATPTADIIPTHEQVKSLTYLTAIIREGLRLVPPVPLIPRRFSAIDTTLGDHFIPAQTPVFVSTIGVHLNDNVWPDSYKFAPERFLNKVNNIDYYSFLPFGAGPRQCIGMNFALLEVKISLSAILRKFKVSLAPGSIHSYGRPVITSDMVCCPKKLDLQFTPLY